MVWPVQQQTPNSMYPSRGPFPGAPSQHQAPQGLQKLLSPQVTQNLLSPDRISGVSNKLNNVQQVLKVVQSAAPIVQEYGPMVKNVPMMLKLIKALNEDNDDTEETKTHTESHNNDGTEESFLTDVSETQTYEQPKSPGQSTPKLFI